MTWPSLEDLRGTVLRPVDYHFGRLLASYAHCEPAAVGLAAALASRALGDGHTALDLDLTGQYGELRALPPNFDAAELKRRLLAEPTVCAASQTQQTTPLILDGSRLYLHRYWQYEQRLARRISSMLGEIPLVDAGIKSRLHALFTHRDSATQAQMLALATALTRRFAIITGGPGTGKTSTLARMLALTDTRGGLQVALAAPTGKAAARMSESLQGQLDDLRERGLADETARASVPERAVTLHRLLGAEFAGNTFRYRADNPLPVDLLIVDEASMIDLRLMHALLDALAPGARLILLGDPDQLDAVEAGNVFGELCRDAGSISPERSRELESLTGFAVSSHRAATALSDAIAVLRHSYRFDVQGGIGRLALAVNAGDVEAVRACLSTPSSQLVTLSLDGGATLDAVRTAASAYARYLCEARRGGAPQKVLELHASFQLLCALRHGAYGVSGLNLAIEYELRATGLLPGGAEQNYPGRPVLVTRNDSSLGLNNGDLGVLLDDGQGTLWAYFISAAGELLRVPASRLPQHETAFALTVHKSQGSEFDHVMLLLPPMEASGAESLLRRELIYTGITRARTSLTLALPDGQLPAAFLRTSLRQSGLAARLDQLWTVPVDSGPAR